MESVARPARGRKRQTARKAVKQEDPAEVSNQIEDVADGGTAPKPTLSQRLATSLKQLSQLGAQPKPEDGEEVEQGERNASAAVPDLDDLQPRATSPITPDAEQQPLSPRKLRFSKPPILSNAPVAATAVLLLGLLLGQWHQGRQAAGILQQLDMQMGTLSEQGVRHAKQLVNLQQAQHALEDHLASLSSSYQQLHSAIASNVGATAATASGLLHSQMEQLQATTGQQAVLIKQLQQAQLQEQQLLQHLQQQQSGVMVMESGSGSDWVASPPAGPSLTAVSKLVKPLMQEEVQRALELFEADRTGMVDYALASGGGRVLAHSRLMHVPAMHGLLGRLANFLNPLHLHPEADKFLLTPGNELGECLPLSGPHGYVDIQLAFPINVTAFTYEHIPASIAFNIRTAPRTMAIYALKEAGAAAGGSPRGSSKAESNRTTTGRTAAGGGGSSGKGAELPPFRDSSLPSSSDAQSQGAVADDSSPASSSGGSMQLLGQLVYDAQHGRAVQTAPLERPPGGAAAGRVRVEVRDNHGHPEYTCLYRIRVHGTRST